MICCCSFPPSYADLSLSICSPRLHQGPREDASASVIWLLTLPQTQTWEAGAAAPLAPRSSLWTHIISFHFQAQWRQLYFIVTSLLPLLYRLSLNRKWTSFESDLIAARPSFQLQQELSTKPADPFLVGKLFKVNWADKIQLFLLLFSEWRILEGCCISFD